MSMEIVIILAATVWNIGHVFLAEGHPIHTAEFMLTMFVASFQWMQNLLAFFLLHPAQDVVKKVKTQVVMVKLIWQSGPGT